MPAARSETPSPLVLCVGLLAAGLALPGCGKPVRPPAVIPNSSAAKDDTSWLVPQPIGAPVTGRPWIAHAPAVDLDRDGLIDVLACESQTNQIVWIRQVARGQFEESVLADGIPGPVRVEPSDLDRDGDLDLLVASMGQVFPNNDRIGSVILLENDGAQHFTPHIVLERVARVTDVQAADFNRDGQLDLAVAQFGYDQGEVRWMERTGDWTFKSHLLLDLSGAINVCIDDFNGDGFLDIVTLISQQWEEIYLFAGDGTGRFTAKVIYGSTNEDYGSSGITLCDLNGDGRSDILFSNGDGFDYAQPGARPWHGVQWLENAGGGFFRYHRIGDLPGAYSPVAVDLDQDGDTDVVAVSGFNDWQNPKSASMMWFRNDGRLGFAPRVLARSPTHLLALTAADLDGTGKPVLITGAFHAYAPFNRMSRVMLWRQKTSATAP